MNTNIIKTGFKKTILATACVAVLSVPFAAQATNGYFAHGYGAKNKGLAGGGVAFAQDAMAAATNPAGMVMVGNRMDIGASLFSPSPRNYTAGASTTGVPDGAVCGANCPFTFGGPGGTQTDESQNDVFLIPHFARNWMLDENSSVGVSIYGNGGMNTEWEGGSAQHNDGVGNAVTTPGTYGAGTAGVNLEQLFINATYARKFANNPKASWGASGIFAYQRFKATGLANFGGYSTDATNLSSGSMDTSSGFGVKFGIQSEVQPGMTLAASYQSKMFMSEFDKYKGLFAENGDFDIPATATIGLAWHNSSNSVFTADVQHIFYEDVDSISNPISYLVGASNSCAAGDNLNRCLGGSEGAGFGWEDMTVLKLGYQWQTDSNWTWRAGVSTTNHPIPTTETVFNILAPAVMETHVTFGFTKQMDKNSEVNFTAMYAPEADVSGTNSLDPTQSVELEMTQFEVEASWGMRF